MDVIYEPTAKPPEANEILMGAQGTTKEVQNTQAMTLHIYPKFFMLEPNTKATKIGKKLIIDRAKCRISEIDMHEQPTTDPPQKKIIFSAFLGIITILDKAFLLICDGCVQVCTFENSDIFRIASSSFIPFDGEQDIVSAPGAQNNYAVYIQNLRKLLEQGYYFSYTYDLTLSKGAQLTKKGPDARYIWNGNLCKELVNQRVDKKWIVPLIQGHIGYFSVYLMGKKLDYYLISRRSRFRSGTRFNARGVDDVGNVANYCEVEQIVCYNGFCCSHIKIRGSVPVFWSQRGLTASIKITRTADYANDAFLKHFNYLNQTYGKVLCVNLMSLTKTGEQDITNVFEDLIKKNDLPTVRYEFFDFHYACRNQQFDKVNLLIKKVHPLNENFKFYAEDRNKTVLLTQKGVIRANCVDCLDRTNVFQSKVAIKIFDVIMRNLGVDLISSFGQDVLQQIDSVNPKDQHPFILNFKNVWADHADAISLHYAGTGSTIANVTRTGGGGILGLVKHGMTTVNRFYIGNWEDQNKQECIDIILGEHTESVDIFGENLERELRTRQSEFASFDNVSLYQVVWNTGGLDPTTFNDSQMLFDFAGNPAPDLLVISFQEIVSLNAANVLVVSNETVTQQWTAVLTSTLQRIDKGYRLLQTKDLVGLFSLIFVNDRIRHRVNRVNTETARAGLLNQFGNKGAVLLKLYVDDTSLLFVNCHLPADEQNIHDRIQVIDDIHRNAFQSDTLGKKKEEKIESLDYRFLMGDMNFRLMCTNQEARQLIDYYCAAKARDQPQNEDLLKSLFNYDELVQFKRNSDYLSRYEEAAINFLPTYKYDLGTQNYDTSKKQRVPSWCDRILYWAELPNKVEYKFYNRREITASDHRPVGSYCTILVKKIDEKKKELVKDEVYKRLNEKPIDVDEDNNDLAGEGSPPVQKSDPGGAPSEQGTKSP